MMEALSDAELETLMLDMDELDRLASLPALQYDRERAAAAEQLGVRASVLDAEIKKRRRGSGEDLQGHNLMLDDPEPWPEPVNGAALLDSLAASAGRFLMLSDGAAEILALWALHTHCHEAGYHTPRLHITAPTKGCGKTTVLDWLSVISPRSVSSESVTTAVLFRLTDAHRPTLLVDEVNRTLKNNGELIAAFNAGHKKGGQHLRCEGDSNTVRAFNTFAPVALAGIGRLPAPELSDRAVPIVMRRATKEQAARLQAFRSDKAALESEMCRKAAKWAASHFDEIAAHDPAMPEGLFNRAADNWRVLFSIADLAGGHWPETARTIAQKMMASITDDEAAVLLLRDLADMFAAKDVDRLASNEIVGDLAERDDRPWPEWRNGKPITTRQLSALLEPFGIVSGTIRTATGTPKGYKLALFKEVFDTYVADAPPSKTPQRHNPQKTAKNDADLPPHHPPVVADNLDKKSQKSNGCGVVADWEAPSGAQTPEQPDRNALVERAAVLEFDGGLSRAEAERQAADEMGIPDFLKRDKGAA